MSPEPRSEAGAPSAVLACSARTVTTAATLLAAVSAAVVEATRTPIDRSDKPLSALVLVCSVAALVPIAWFGSRLRYGAVMLLCAAVGLVPWTDDWWYGDGTRVAGYGAALASSGVLLTSFISANSKPALRQAWEQCAPAASAAAGWLSTLALFVIVTADRVPWFPVAVLVGGAVAFLGLALALGREVKRRTARGVARSPYMAKRSLRSVLLLKFFGGSCYVLLAMAILWPASLFMWARTGGSYYQRPHESFTDDGRKSSD